MKKLILLGAGGFARELYWQIKNATTDFKLLGLVGEDPSAQLAAEGISLLPESNTGSPDHFWLAAVGKPGLRKKIVSKYQGSGLGPAIFVHDSAIPFGPGAIETGSMICAGTRITSNVLIGKHVLVNLNCSIGHDVVLHDFVTLHPGVHVNGNVTIGSGTEIGSGAVILPGITIGKDVVIGAGAVVTRDITQAGTYAGVPAKLL